MTHTIHPDQSLPFNEWSRHVHRQAREITYPVPVRPLQMKLPMDHMVMDHVNDLYRYHFKGSELIWTRIGSVHIENKTK